MDAESLGGDIKIHIVFSCKQEVNSLLYFFHLKSCLTVLFILNLIEAQVTFYLHQRLLSEILEELMEKLTACSQHCFMGSELVSCKTQEGG